jgi:hypothetical protein
VADLDCAWLSASVTVAVKLDVPLVVGVPEITPVLGVKLSPAGRLPEVIDQVYGAVPPLALRAVEKGVPEIPEGSVEDAIASWIAATTTDVAADVVWAGLLLSLTFAVKLNVPLAVGVPEITPVPLARLNPAGRLPEPIDHWYGAVPPFACREPL